MKSAILQGKRQGPKPAVTAEDGPCRTFNPMVDGSSPSRLIRRSPVFAGLFVWSEVADLLGMRRRRRTACFGLGWTRMRCSDSRGPVMSIPRSLGTMRQRRCAVTAQISIDTEQVASSAAGTRCKNLLSSAQLSGRTSARRATLTYSSPSPRAPASHSSISSIWPKIFRVSLVGACNLVLKKGLKPRIRGSVLENSKVIYAAA